MSNLRSYVTNLSQFTSNTAQVNALSRFSSMLSVATSHENTLGQPLSRHSSTKIATLNLRSERNLSQIADVCELLYRKDIEIACLQEIRREKVKT